MKLKRKSILVFVIVFAVLVLAGCNTTSATTTTTTTTSVTTATTESSATTTTTTVSTQPETFTVSFETFGGSAVTTLSVEDGTLLSEATSTLEDYSLLGWYLEDSFDTEWNFSTDTVTSNITLYAKWQFSYMLSGEGTETTPYLVSTAKDLNVIRDGQFVTTAEMYFEQTADLTIETTFEDIDGAVFNGTYNGEGFTITVTGDSGVFYQNAGTITNLNLVGDIETDSVNSIGMLANYNAGTVSLINVSGIGIRSLVGTVGTLEDGIGGAGAIVGTNLSTGLITNSESHTNIQARVGGGGIVGNNQGTVTLCSSWGTVGEQEVIYISEAEASVGKFSYMGGIAGLNSGDVLQSQNRGRVFAQRAGNTLEVATNGNKVFGGIVGYNYADGLVSECYNAYGTAGSTVHADRIVGGIVGQNFGTVTYSYSPANIGGRANIGGIIGLSDESEGSVAYVAYSWSNSNFRSDGNETDEIAPFLSTDASNWYSVSKYCDYSYYHATRGMAPTGEGNLDGVSVTLDLTAILNTGLASGSEKYIITDGSSSGNAKTKLAWQQNSMVFDVEGIETVVTVPMGNTPLFAGTPEKNGYLFMEWRTVLEDSQTAWNPSGITANGKVYAYFELATYQIEYILDGGTNDVLNPDSYTLETPSIALLDPTREGCNFLGWFVGEDEVTTIELGSYGDLVLTAKWEITAAYITVHYADENLIDVTLLDLVSASLTLPVVEQLGFEFLGWSLDGTTVAYLGEAVVTYTDLNPSAVEGVVTLTPLFEQIFNYTISYDANGATGTMDDQIMVTGKAGVLNANSFTASGFTFMGWKLNGVLIEDGASVTDLALSGETAVLVAQWLGTTTTFSSTFDTDGSFLLANETLDPIKLYTFDDWFLYRNGTTNVPEMTGAVVANELVVDATITTGATSLNFYLYHVINVPGITDKDLFYVTFDAKVNDETYQTISVYIRATKVGSTTFRSVTDLTSFTTLGTTYNTFSTTLMVDDSLHADNLLEGNTYYILIPLGVPGGGVAGTFEFTIDNVHVYKIGSAN